MKKRIQRSVFMGLIASSISTYLTYSMGKRCGGGFDNICGEILIWATLVYPGTVISDWFYYNGFTSSSDLTLHFTFLIHFLVFSGISYLALKYYLVMDS